MGAAQFGSSLLTEILNRQPGTRVTHAQLPWLPWESAKGAPGIGERLQRILVTTAEPRVGDVASFYLPYAEEAICCEPGIRVICLKASRVDVVSGLSRQVDQEYPAAVNHWAQEPAPGWSHDPFTTRIYPQYDTSDRSEGIARYWDEYYDRAERLQELYPDNVCIWDVEALTTAAGVREILTFAGVPAAEQVIVAGKLSGAVNGAVTRPRIDPLDPRKCAVLVPFTGTIHPECEAGLKALECQGYQVRRVPGYAAIDQARNQMATDALRDGFDETMWIDSDIVFDPEAVDQLRSHDLPLVCGI